MSSDSLGLFEGETPVFVYNHGKVTRPGVPADRARSTYIHPIYGLDGEVLTDDFPRDHRHHRGLFWAWPHVQMGGKSYDLWMLHGMEQRFSRWLARETALGQAKLGVENGWHIGDRKVAREEVWIRVHAATPQERVLDLEIVIEPLAEPITLQGAAEKSYGGLTLRYAPGSAVSIKTPLGADEKDLAMTRLPWADFSSSLIGRTQRSGIAILVAPDHPDCPPEWLTRHYGVLCVGWPGVKPRTVGAGEAVRLRYRLVIHRGQLEISDLNRLSLEYAQETVGNWSNKTP
ncbi:MAG: DUF6807 family protein [Verrucomicrobiota bacterium]